MTTLRTMYDSVTATNLPARATLVAAYVDGLYANVTAVHLRCPHARIVTITVLGGHTPADVVDVERGDCTPTSGAAWAKWRHSQGAHPTIYCSHSVVPDVVAACRRVGLVLHRDYELWVAHYDDVAELEDGAVAKQYRSTDKIDTSVVALHWPGVDSIPGHLYIVVAGDDSASIARRGQMSLAKLEEVNDKVNWHAPLEVGQRLWIIPGAR